MSMRPKTNSGESYDSGLQSGLRKNQSDMIDALITPHVRIPEKLGGSKITSTVPAYTPDTQPVQARGRIVWNNAYSFQARGPSYLDGTDR